VCLIDKTQLAEDEVEDPKEDIEIDKKKQE